MHLLIQTRLAVNDIILIGQFQIAIRPASFVKARLNVV